MSAPFLNLAKCPFKTWLPHRKGWFMSTLSLNLTLNSPSATEYERRGNKFHPQMHIIYNVQDKRKAPWVEALIAKYDLFIVAHCLCFDSRFGVSAWSCSSVRTTGTGTLFKNASGNIEKARRNEPRSATTTLVCTSGFTQDGFTGCRMAVPFCSIR